MNPSRLFWFSSNPKQKSPAKIYYPTHDPVTDLTLNQTCHSPNRIPPRGMNDFTQLLRTDESGYLFTTRSLDVIENRKYTDKLVGCFATFVVASCHAIR